MKKVILLLLLGACVHARELLYDDQDESASDVHGIVDFSFKNDYITTRGLLVTDTGLTVQVLTGLSLDLYKNDHQPIQSVALNFGIWNDIWTEQNDPTVGAWNELDWFIGISLGIQKNWKLQAQFIEFVSPPGNFRPENNVEFILTYNDTDWNLPLTINPYMKLFWAVSGDSTVVVGRHGDTYYFEFGMVPLFKWEGDCLPITVAFPTWFSVGPESFWNGSKEGLKGGGNFGLFSTGLRARIPLKWIPTRIGNWYLEWGGQYYYLINDNLLQAQLFTLQLNSRRSAYRNVGVGFIGLGFEF